MQDGERLMREEVLHVAGQIANGMAYIHDSGVVHCDLKPENILVKMVERRSDFGEEETSPLLNCVCRITDFGNSYNFGGNPRVTRGKLIGTLP